MRYKDFLLYLENSLDGYSAFIEKALEYQNEKNKKRQPAKRWNEEKMHKAAYDMWKSAMEPLYNQLKSSVKSDMEFMWIDFIRKNNVLDSVNEGIYDLDFSEQSASA